MGLSGSNYRWFQIGWYLHCCHVVYCFIHHGLSSNKRFLLKCEIFEQRRYTSVSLVIPSVEP